MCNASHFFSLLLVITSFRNMGTKRTEADWMRIHENAIYAILTGKSANVYLGNMSMNSLIDDAVWGADDLIKRLKEREDDENSD